MKKALIILVAWILMVLIWTWLLGCNTLRKAIDKQKIKTDSTRVVSERKDSTSTTEATFVHKDSSKTQDEVIIDFVDKNDSSDSGIRITPKNAEDYFYINSKTGVVTTNRIPGKVIIRGSAIKYDYDSLLKSITTSIQEEKKDSTRKLQDETIKSIEKHRSTFTWWWILLLIIPAILWYYRRRIVKFFLP